MRFPIDSYTDTSNKGNALPSLGYAGNTNNASAGPIAALNGQIFMVNGTNNVHIGWMVNMISEKLIDVIRYGSATNQCYFRSSHMSNRSGNYGALTADNYALGTNGQYGHGDDYIHLVKVE